jgi:adenosylmethionine-8-amino-7-oxononanoate aminotransferase
MKGDILIIAPPLIITAAEVDEIIQIVREVLTEAAGR